MSSFVHFRSSCFQEETQASYFFNCFPQYFLSIRRDLHWLPIQARIRFKMNVITRNCLVGQAPEYLTELCRPINEVPARRNLRSAAQVQLLVPRFRKERTGRRGFSISSPQLWNLLPVDIRTLYEEPNLFRKRLKTHLMQQPIFHH